jgi:transposase
MFDASDDAKGGYRRIEVLTGPGRRRRWSAAEKARIVAESLAPGACVSEVARRWQILPQQVFGWRRSVRCSTTTPSPAAPATASPAFIPIVSEPEAPAFPASVVATSPATIEIRLAGAVVRAAPGTDATHLTAVLRAVRASAR